MGEKFQSSSFKDPIRRDEVEFTDKGVTFREKKLIGGTDNFVFYSDISGVEIDNGLFFATVRVIPRAPSADCAQQLLERGCPAHQRVDSAERTALRF